MIHYRYLTLVVLAALLPATLTMSRENDSPAVTKLLEERRDVLRNLLNIVTEQYTIGDLGFESVLRASDKLLAAELELAANPETRISVLKKRVEMMQSLLKRTEATFAIGRIGQTDVLEAKAALIKARIELLREQEVPREGKTP